MWKSSQGLSADFKVSGINFSTGSNHWALTLRGYGYREKLIGANIVAPHVSADRLEYEGGLVSEWYVNGPAELNRFLPWPASYRKTKGQPGSRRP